MSWIPTEHQTEVGELYREVGVPLASFAARLLQADRQDALDLTHEVFQLAAIKWDRLRHLDRSAQRAWLYQTMRHKVFKQWKKAKTQPAVPDPQDCPEPMLDFDTSIVAADNILLDKCWKVIDALPRAQRCVALLAWQGGWTTAEIAAHLDIASTTVRVHLMRARRTINEECGADWRDTPEGEETG